MKTLLRNLLLAIPVLLFLSCEDFLGEFNVSKDISFDIEISAGNFSNINERLIAKASTVLDIGSDDFDEYELEATKINTLAISIRNVDATTGVLAFSIGEGTGVENTDLSVFSSTSGTLRNVTDPQVFYRDGNLVESEFFVELVDLNNFVTAFESAIKAKSDFPLFVAVSLGSNGSAEDFTITIHVDITTTASN